MSDACDACLRAAHAFADQMAGRAPGFELVGARRDLRERGVGGLCLHSPRYPPALHELDDPPPVLFVAGRVERLEELLEEPSVTIVGTRRPSPYGLEVAAGLGRGLAAAGVTVVSGLALGIDAAALRGSVDRGNGIAVLASGPDVPYPRTNRRLHAELVRCGAVVSEAPPGRPAMKWGFPARNRIMAALGQMTVVVEAAERSGSLITTTVAAKLGRTVGAVPGRVTSRMAAGTNSLLFDGARLVRGPECVLDELFGVGLWRGRGGEEEPELPDELADVLAAVEAGEGIEATGRRAGLAAAGVRRALARLEALGLVVRDPLGRYERALPGGKGGVRMLSR